MKTAKLTLFGLGLAGAVGFAVSTLAAQSEPPNQDLVRPRVMMLDGRGARIGVEVNDVAEGVRVESVDPGSPAAKAGLAAGDVVLELDGERVRSARHFARLIQETADGRSVVLHIVRNGNQQTVNVTPESRRFDVSFDGDRLGRDIARGLRELEPRMREFPFNGRSISTLMRCRA